MSETGIFYLLKNGRLVATVTLELGGLDHFVFSEDIPPELCEEVMVLRKTISETNLVKRKTAFQKVYVESGFVVEEYER